MTPRVVIARPGRRSRVAERDPMYVEQLVVAIALAKLPPLEREYLFDPTRKWRFDLAAVADRVGIEVEGGSWSAGRHVRGRGFEEDARKYNAAAVAGWRLIRVTGAMVQSGEALDTIAAALASRRSAP